MNVYMYVCTFVNTKGTDFANGSAEVRNGEGGGGGDGRGRLREIVREVRMYVCMYVCTC